MARNNYNKNSADFAVNTTLALSNQGSDVNVTVDAVVITLPATSAGAVFTIRNGGASDGAVGFSVSPNASDKIQGLGFTAADNKDAINTKATAKAGIDFITLVGDGVDGWNVFASAGTFAREA